MWWDSCQGQNNFFLGFFWGIFKTSPSHASSRLATLLIHISEIWLSGRTQRRSRRLLCENEISSLIFSWLLASAKWIRRKTVTRKKGTSKRGRYPPKEVRKKFWKVPFRCKINRQSGSAHQNQRFFSSSWSFLRFFNLAYFWPVFALATMLFEIFKFQFQRRVQHHEEHLLCENQSSNLIFKDVTAFRTFRNSHSPLTDYAHSVWQRWFLKFSNFGFSAKHSDMTGTHCAKIKSLGWFLKRWRCFDMLDIEQKQALMCD